MFVLKSQPFRIYGRVFWCLVTPRAPVSVVSVLHVEHKNDVKHIQSLPLPLQANHDAKLMNGLAIRRPRRVSLSVLEFRNITSFYNDWTKSRLLAVEADLLSDPTPSRNPNMGVTTDV